MRSGCAATAGTFKPLDEGLDRQATMWGDRHFPLGLKSLDAIQYLFNSEQDGIRLRGQLDDYATLHRLIVAGDILVREEPIACCAPPKVTGRNRMSGASAKVFRKAKAGGGHLHGWLKYWTYYWLLDSHGVEPDFEVTLPNYGRADVFCSTPRIIVECGNTSPGHALTGLTHEFADSFIVVPFQRAMLANIGTHRPYCELKGFAFTVAACQVKHNTRP